MRPSLAVVVAMLLLPSVLSAQPSLETCARFEWDAVGDTSMVGMVFLYVRREGESYQMTPPGGTPNEARPALKVAAWTLAKPPTMVLSVPCSKLSLAAPGVYYSVITFVSRDFREEGPPSNELRFTYQLAAMPPPSAPTPPAPSPYPPFELPTPYPPIIIPPYTPLPQPAPGGSELISETCMWQGLNCGY